MDKPSASVPLTLLSSSPHTSTAYIISIISVYKSLSICSFLSSSHKLRAGEERVFTRMGASWMRGLTTGWRQRQYRQADDQTQH